MQETQVQSLGWEDPLEKEVATHSSIAAWRMLLSMRSQTVRHDFSATKQQQRANCHHRLISLL